jgi:hypothetical protein
VDSLQVVAAVTVKMVLVVLLVQAAVLLVKNRAVAHLRLQLQTQVVAAAVVMTRQVQTAVPDL